VAETAGDSTTAGECARRRALRAANDPGSAPGIDPAVRIGRLAGGRLPAFRNACHKFIFTEVLRKPVAVPEAAAPANGSSPAAEASESAVVPAATMARPAFPTDFLMEALEKSADDSGWAHLGTFGSYLQKIQPDFDSRLHGFKKLSDLVRGRDDLFLTEERIAPAGTSKVLYIRARKKR